MKVVVEIEIDVEICVTRTSIEVVNVTCGSVTVGGVAVTVICGRTIAGGVDVVVVVEIEIDVLMETDVLIWVIKTSTDVVTVT